MTKPDLLPDEDATYLRKWGRTMRYQADGDRFRRIADRLEARTPNKSAEVDLDAIRADIWPSNIDEYLNGIRCGVEDRGLQNDAYGAAEWAYQEGLEYALSCLPEGHLATGKGGDDTPQPSPQSDMVAVPITGDTSDGYHTFNELYEHRHTLFAALLRCYPTEAWKSKKHDDGTMFDGWFIAGIHTPEGNATYHIPMRLWDTFEAHEVETAPKWDGHTSADVCKRLSMLQPYTKGE